MQDIWAKHEFIQEKLRKVQPGRGGADARWVACMGQAIKQISGVGSDASCDVGMWAGRRDGSTGRGAIGCLCCGSTLSAKQVRKAHCGGSSQKW
ncbi:hypothetical protein CCHR01_06505 [Colletotrichum chrysophilum]|uniref:Uncharacterized protein n=1 Tax=Colletotrichum chrysophilum TaxID=1836956 RepID=A0AAD9EJQ6_9PEZI|nr:hypothetical protein K456DRAFT_547319 [Colletotrichum gloeosporioides 23]KAK1850848.1 hypothetical protein CCHR01_06505 [Colletotrichum chrysophilum]